MKTNLEKFNTYYNLALEKCNAFIKSTINELPKILYCISGYYGVSEKIITGCYYYPSVPQIEKPTKKDIEAAIKWLNDNKPLAVDNIYIKYEEILSYGKSSGALKYSSFIDRSIFVSNKSELDEEIKKRKELYEPREGYINCAYCHKVVLKENAVPRKIIFQSWSAARGKHVAEETNLYCSSQCGFNDQCGHEG